METGLGSGTLPARHARIALCALTGACAALGLGGGFIWDDLLLLVQNPAVRGDLPAAHVWSAPLIEQDPSGHVYYRPVVSYAFALCARAFGASPLPFHVLSWLLYLALVWLSVGFLRARVSPGMRSDRLPWAVLFAATWLALHPTRAQSVAWVTGAFDLWMALFALVAWQCVERDRAEPGPAIGAGLACAFALWSKEAAVAIPLWLAADVALRHGQDGLRARRFSLAAALLGTCMALGVRTLFTVAPAAGPFDDGAGALLSRMLVSLGFLVWRVLWPFDLTIQREGPLGDLAGLPPELLALAVLGLVTLLGASWLALACRRRPAWRAVLADVAGFLILVGPTLNVVIIGQHGGSLSERYLLLPLFPVGSLLARALLRVPPQRKRLALLSAAGLALAFALQYQVEQGRFSSARAFFDSLLHDDPSALFAYDQAVDLARADGDYARTSELAETRALVALRALPEGPRGDPGRAVALLRYANTWADLVSDASQDALRELREFLEALLTGEPTASLMVGDARFEVGGDREVLAHLEAVGGLEDARLLRVVMNARTLQLERAATLLQGPATPLDSGERRQRLRAKLALWTSNLEALEGLARSRVPDAAPTQEEVLVRDLRQALQRGDRLTEARVVAAAGLPARARRIADEADAPPVLRAEIDLFDGRPDLALQHLSRAPPGPRASQLTTQAQALLARGRRIRR